MLRYNTFWVIVLSIFCVLIFPDLLAEGMFLDGIIYSDIARNLSIGNGTLWNLKYIETLSGPNGSNTFAGHPSPGFWIQALFFMALGDHTYTENIYSLFTCIINLFMIKLIWQTIQINSMSKKMSWLPILLWIIVPVTYWSFSNNLLENTMSIFCLASIYFYIKWITKSQLILIALSALFIILSALTKGPAGLFPLAAPLANFIASKHFSFYHFLRDQFYLLGISAVFGLSLFLYPPAANSLLNYLDVQILHSLANVSTVDNRFQLLATLLAELWYVLLLAVLVIYFVKKDKTKLEVLEKNWSNFFLILGIFASLPIMISLKQRSFYLLPSIPFFSLWIALILRPYVLALLLKYNLFFETKIWIRFVPIFVMIVGIVIITLRIPYENRDQLKLETVRRVGEKIGKNQLLSCSRSTYTDWSLTAYFQRKYCISTDHLNLNEYYLFNKTTEVTSPPGYSSIILETNQYSLFKK